MEDEQLPMQQISPLQNIDLVRGISISINKVITKNEVEYDGFLSPMKCLTV